MLQNKAITITQYIDDDSILDLNRSVIKIEPEMKLFFQETYGLMNANKVAFLPYSDMYLSIHFHANKFQLRKTHNFLLTSTYIPRKNVVLNLSSESETCFVSAVMSCDEFIKQREGKSHINTS